MMTSRTRADRSCKYCPFSTWRTATHLCNHTCTVNKIFWENQNWGGRHASNISSPSLERIRVKSRLAVAWRMDSSGCCSSACIRPSTTCLIMLSPRPSRPPQAHNTKLLGARWYRFILSQSRSLHVLAQLQSGWMMMSHHSVGGGAVRHDCVLARRVGSCERHTQDHVGVTDALSAGEGEQHRHQFFHRVRYL